MKLATWQLKDLDKVQIDHRDPDLEQVFGFAENLNL